MKVDFPDPFPPMMKTSSPRRTVKSMGPTTKPGSPALESRLAGLPPARRDEAALDWFQANLASARTGRATCNGCRCGCSCAATR
ncbi:hypothetical protein [Muricoccus aerilatus]|uniref:hypothetical protein n=1 Tax=Muricoccus aerilatus TaxID=452982 RepID=UPI000694EEAE|nr:hypothetical protein [Roseomonas aerilata]